ncbi:hypothetical protein [Hyalangium sp.]|uniref:hypothetical protein n=1 Tax=Hyalangium sp. TaxID=2028555 RepID=UPI002D665C57|nr:hypothetical protein [Hyalangium sp.]HYI00728.1 hypothetical protein [Hyalangium sp.]
MRVGTGGLLAGLAALLLTAGCKEGRPVGEPREGEQASAAQSVEQAQKQSEQAFDQAEEAQGKASAEQRDAAQAQRDVQEAQKSLAEAQGRARTEAQEAQTAQQQAQQQTQAAQQAVTQSQQNALDAQRQQQSELAQPAQPQAGASPPAVQAPAPSTQAQGEQVIVGEVLTVNDRELLVSSRGEPQRRLQVQPGTVILVDGRQARAADIEEGSQVRASFHDQGGEPTATRIEVTTSVRPAIPAAPESGESTPGAQPQEAPFQEN